MPPSLLLHTLTHSAGAGAKLLVSYTGVALYSRGFTNSLSLSRDNYPLFGSSGLTLKTLYHETTRVKMACRKTLSCTGVAL